MKEREREREREKKKEKKKKKREDKRREERREAGQDESQLQHQTGRHEPTDSLMEKYITRHSGTAGSCTQEQNEQPGAVQVRLCSNKNVRCFLVAAGGNDGLV
jgi:hypothetical protein